MIDIHAHYLSPSVLRAAERGSLPIAYDPARRVMVLASGPSRPIPPSLTDLDERLNWLGKLSIDLQVLSPWMDIAGDSLEASEASVWCQLLNDTVAEDLTDSPEFKAFAALPVSSGEAAAKELARSVEELGLLGGAIPTQVNGVDLDVAGLEPLFEAAEALEVPLFVHPFRVMASHRMDKNFLANVCGNPFETTLAAFRIFFWNAFDRWPRLKLILAHSGGVLPFLAGRASHASKYAPGTDRTIEDPYEILGRFYYDTVLHDSRALALAMSSIGPSRIAAGTDAPFPMRLEDPVGHIQDACAAAGLDESACNQIMRITATDLLDI